MRRLVELPDGWTIEALSEEGIFLFKHPHGYMVTVDYDRRGFRVGLSTAGRFATKGVFKGRGWEQALIDAAVKHLSEAVNTDGGGR